MLQTADELLCLRIQRVSVDNTEAGREGLQRGGKYIQISRLFDQWQHRKALFRKLRQHDACCRLLVKLGVITDHAEPDGSCPVTDAGDRLALPQQAAEFIGHGVGYIDEAEIGAGRYIGKLAECVIDDCADIFMPAADSGELVHDESL